MPVKNKKSAATKKKKTSSVRSVNTKKTPQKKKPLASAKKATKKPVNKKLVKKAVSKKLVSKKPIAKKKLVVLKRKSVKKPAVSSAKKAKSVVKKPVAKKIIPKASKPKKVVKKTTNKVIKKEAAKKTIKKIAPKKVIQKVTQSTKPVVLVTPKKVTQPSVASHKDHSSKKSPTVKLGITPPKVMATDTPKPLPLTIPNKKPIISANAVKRVKRPGSGPAGFLPYEAKTGEDYMSDAQLAHFQHVLHLWKEQLYADRNATTQHMRDDTINFPDPLDRAALEEEHTLEWRAREREHRLIIKIDQALASIKQGDYGYCEACGAEIGVRRLEARPTATQCIDCKTIDEIRERHTGTVE